MISTFPGIFKKVKTNREIFRESPTKYLLIFSCFSTVSFIASEMELDYYHQKVDEWVAWRVPRDLRLTIFQN